MTLTVMAQYAAQKGIDILTASDFTHPLWFKEISNLLEEAEEGMYKLKEPQQEKEIRFLLSTEISSIYKQGDKLRRIHNLIFVPSLEVAEKINKELVRRGCNISADGRPIVGLSSKALLELILSIDDRSFLIPCHIWTPHFGIYGSASGFDSLEEAFGDLAPQIYGIETGLSSDPDMNWQVTELKNRTILSFSDAHSAPKMAREATVFDLEAPTYENIRKAIMYYSVKDEKNKIAYTLEFYPEEGKYHFSGHRNCKVVFGPEEIKEMGTVCPVCKRRLTEGVFMRVEQLSDPKLLGRAEEKKNAQGLKWYTDKAHLQPPYVKLVPLLEIVAEAMSSTVASQKAKNMFIKLCLELHSELDVLLKSPLEDIEKVAGWKIAEAVKKVREGNIAIAPGFDGEFGKVKIWSEEEEKAMKGKPINVPQLSFDI
jgi:uncharacterized protein (TIGR00375 family)